MKHLPFTRCTVMLMGRHDWQRDSALNSMLVERLEHLGVRIVWEEAGAEILYRLQRLEQSLPWLPALPSRCRLALAQVLYAFCHPSYILRPWVKRHDSEAAKARRLQRQLQRLSRSGPLVILARSAGGRRASRVADACHVAHIICLGYPFRHPQHGDEPERYAHLGSLATPMLIVQGIRDTYGGREVGERYALSPAIDLKFVDADHDFQAGPAELQRVCQWIEAVLTTHGQQRAPTSDWAKA